MRLVERSLLLCHGILLSFADVLSIERLRPTSVALQCSGSYVDGAFHGRSSDRGVRTQSRASSWRCLYSSSL